jgi:anti-sigma factor RsiW
LAVICDPQNPSHCLQLFDKLSEYIDGEMEEAERRDIEAHIAHCAACLGCLQSLKRTIALCKQTGHQSVPAVFSEKLHTMIQHIRSAP